MQNEEKPTKKYYYPGAVLQSDHILDFVNKGLLIVDDTFNEQRLRNAKYDIRLGKAYYKSGKYGNLDDNNPLLEITPGELVFTESYEIFKMPENVIARYDLRISGCLGGLGLQTGLQLDPLYHGRIFCPLFNFSNVTLLLTYGEQLASMEFSYTTAPPKKMKPFGGEREGLLYLRQALPHVPRQSGLEGLWEKFKEFNDETNRLETKFDAMVSAVFQGMAFMIAALGILVAAISIGVIPGFKIGAEVGSGFVDWSFVIKIAIGIVICFGVAYGGYLWMINRIRKISKDKNISKEKTKIGEG